MICMRFTRLRLVRRFPESLQQVLSNKCPPNRDSRTADKNSDLYRFQSRVQTFRVLPSDGFKYEIKFTLIRNPFHKI